MIQRRTFLEAVGGVIAGAFARVRLPAAGGDRIGVVGAGIVGASVAHALARRGARVTIFEREAPASGTTGRSFAWLNAHFTKQPYSYYLLNHLGVLAWRELDDELGGALRVQWTGAVEWTTAPEPDRELREGVARLQRWGSSTRLIDAGDLRALEPGIVPGALRSALRADEEGAVDAAVATSALLDRARAAGADLRAPCEVAALDVREGRLRGVRTSQGDVELDALVLAAGVDTPRLATQVAVDLPLRHAPGLILRTAPLSKVLTRIVVAPLVHARQAPDGRVVVGEDPGPPQDEPHQHLLGDVRDFPDEDVRARHAARLLAETARFVPALEDASVERLVLGRRPLPKDGLPAVGPAAACPDVYVAVTHSGVTLGPLLGRLASIEILDRVQTDLLQPFRPGRF